MSIRIEKKINVPRAPASVGPPSPGPQVRFPRAHWSAWEERVCVCGGEDVFIRTNLWNASLISADRNNKATLLLTILCSIQVVCKGFNLSNISNCCSEATGETLPSPGIPPCCDSRPKSILNRLIWREKIVAFQHGFRLRGVQPLPYTW